MATSWDVEWHRVGGGLQRVPFPHYRQPHVYPDHIEAHSDQHGTKKSHKKTAARRKSSSKSAHIGRPTKSSRSATASGVAAGAHGARKSHSKPDDKASSRNEDEEGSSPASSSSLDDKTRKARKKKHRKSAGHKIKIRGEEDDELPVSSQDDDTLLQEGVDSQTKGKGKGFFGAVVGKVKGWLFRRRRAARRRRAKKPPPKPARKKPNGDGPNGKILLALWDQEKELGGWDEGSTRIGKQNIAKHLRQLVFAQLPQKHQFLRQMAIFPRYPT